MPGERRGGRARATPNRRTILAERIVAVLGGRSAASPEERLARLVNDQELPGDIRLAVAQKGLPAQSRQVRPARQAKSELPKRGRARLPSPSASGEPRSVDPRSAASPLAEAMSRDTLEALFDIVCDANAPTEARRKAAMTLATYFLPKKPANKRWRGFTKDKCGFAINAEIARDYRAVDSELWALKRHPNRDFPEFMQRIVKLQAKRGAIRWRLKCPSHTRYGAEQIREDYSELVALAAKREDGIALTAEEDNEEAHRKARFDSYLEGPERLPKRRRQDLESRDHFFRMNRFFGAPTPPPLSRKEANDLWLLRWLYPRRKAADDPEARARVEAELALLFPDDGILEEFVDLPPYCICISGQPMYFTDVLPASLQGRDTGGA